MTVRADLDGATLLTTVACDLNSACCSRHSKSRKQLTLPLAVIVVSFENLSQNPTTYFYVVRVNRG